MYINKSAGMVTVSATSKQLQRLDKYVADLQKKMQTQVMIDVKIYSVTFEDGSTTGIDWSQLYALQNIDIGFNSYDTKNITSFTGAQAAAGGGTNSNIISPITEITGTANSIASIFQIGAKGSIKEVIKFLKTQGDVHAVSNPKILTLNNQPALITSGTELFYRTQSSTAAASTGGPAVGGTTDVVSSVFAGVLLDITPEISDDGSITLRINPSISEVASQLKTDGTVRDMPPDLSRRQMSSVVTAKDGSTIIMGGLIGTRNDMTGSKIPLLGDIPVLGWLFKTEGITKKTEEMVIIIQPHIIKRDGSNMNLSDLGYSRMGSSMEKDEIARNALLKQSDEEIKELKELTKNSK
ncbi:MAG: pilus (MSHA type) biogenesis protein MshL [Sulfuricurvum sp. 24-42-5]|nr:MAG: pilus (MSHA type) biogenesis protein MshL [Sulfuricurvum sp. 24-42-5]